MKLTVLVDNNTYIDRYFLGEPALSFYIQEVDTTILFDTGYSNVFIQNAKSMGLDLSSVNTVVISHGHVDHTGGLPRLNSEFNTSGMTIYAHPLAFANKQLDGINIGSTLSEEEIRKIYKVLYIKKPTHISENLIMLGEIPSYYEFEKRQYNGMAMINGQSFPDYNIDDTALVYKTCKGIYIVTGCSHSGICGILEYAQEVCSDNRVLGVIGGFHLLEKGAQLEGTLKYLKKKNIPGLYPCHCVSMMAKVMLANHMNIAEVGVGMTLDWS